MGVGLCFAAGGWIGYRGGDGIFLVQRRPLFQRGHTLLSRYKPRVTPRNLTTPAKKTITLQSSPQNQHHRAVIGLSPGHFIYRPQHEDYTLIDSGI